MAVPTIFYSDGFRFFFYSNEGNEPVHVHVEKGSGYAKYWMQPVRMDYAEGFNRRDIRRMTELVVENQQRIVKAREEHFGR